MSEEIVRWADSAMYGAAPIKKDEQGIVNPQVYLLWATPDPLGVIAAVCRMYEGKPTYDLSDITDEERSRYWEESFKSHLRTPHEFVQFHFMFEAVTRDITHQIVRKRQNSYGQESLRFAVKQNLAQEVPLPPSLRGADESIRSVWEETVKEIEFGYTRLIEAGIPAEDARGLLPHAVPTRIHVRTELRTLLDEAGNRLCTQAQFQWRALMLGIMKAISEYGKMHSSRNYRITEPDVDYHRVIEADSSWQFETLGRPAPRTFAPVCYHTGRCQFESTFDRDCSIRDRVNAFASRGVSSSEWGNDYGWVEAQNTHDPEFTIQGRPEVRAINPEEWLLNPGAAR